MQEKSDRQWWLQYQCELNPYQYVSDENARRIALVNKKVGVRSPQKSINKGHEIYDAEELPSYRVGMRYQDRGLMHDERNRIIFEDDYLEEDPLMISTHSYESGIPTKYYDFEQLEP